MGTTNVSVSVPSHNHPQELKLHDCLIKVTRLEDGHSALFWLGGYVYPENDEIGFNLDGSFDPITLSYDDFEQDLVDHLFYDRYEDEIQWDYNSPLQSQEYTDEAPSAVRGYNSWVAALLAMQHASFGRVGSVRFNIV
ncbi:unnamed protein product [Penicillium glandicola]